MKYGNCHGKIKFVLDGIEFQATEGITWFDWAKDKNNWSALSHSNASDVLGDIYHLDPTLEGYYTSQVIYMAIKKEDGSIPYWEDEIINGAVYTVSVQY